MKKPLAIIKETKVELTTLFKRIRRDKTTLVSAETLNLATDLTESIKADTKRSRALRKQTKQSVDWPFPTGRP
jgi:hypothetical protein